jgi:hypothetical protein
MSLDIIHLDPATFVRVQQSDQPVVVYECKLQGVPCGMSVEGTTTAFSAHLRRQHGMTGPDNASISCRWGSCSKTIKRGSMARHILTHLGVKVRCAMCGVVKCRRDILRAHIISSNPCHFAIMDAVHGPEGRAVLGTFNTATDQV